MRSNVLAERVFVGVAHNGASGRWRRWEAQIVNEAQTVMWGCGHRHMHRETALDCAHKQRRRMVRAGTGRV